jgi:RNA-directed DNA polymerase
VNGLPQPLELFAASPSAERLGRSDRLMDMILERDNLIRAWKRVCGNKGAPGVDGITTDQLWEYLKSHWPHIKQDLLSGAYKPQTGETGRNTKAGRWRPLTWHPHGA